MKRGESKGLSIFTRLLIALLGVVLCTSVILTVVFYVFSRNSLERQSKELITQQFEAIRHHFRYDLKDDIIRELQVLASNPVLNEFMMSSQLDAEIHARAAERLFLESIQYSKSYRRIRFVDYSGKEKISVNRKGRIKKYHDISGNQLFSKIESGDPNSIYVKSPFVDKAGDVLFLIGIHKSDPDIGEFGGAVIIDFSLKDFLEYLNKILIFNENPTWVFTPQGKILKQPLKGRAFFDPQVFFTKEFQKYPLLRTYKEGVLMYQDFFITPGNPLIRCSISIPSSLLFEDIASILKFLGLVFLLLMITISALAFYLARYLSLPIVELADASAMLARGDLSTQVSIRTTGEVQTLIDGFNQMARDLEKTTVSKEYVDNIINSMSNAIIVASPEGKIIRINPATTTLLSYQETELINQSIGMVIDGGHPQKSSLQNDVLKEDSIQNVKRAFVAKDGRIIPVLLSVSVLRDFDETVKGIVCEVQDLTQQKRVAKEKKLLEVKLQRAQKMEAIGTLAGGVAHDLNNILSGLVSYPELLLMDIPNDSPLRDPILTIKGSGEKAATIVQDLLTLARRGVSIKKIVDMNQIVSDYLKSLEHKKLIAYHPKIRIKTSPDSNLLNVLGSPVHLSKTVMNLISNSAEAMPDGGEILISTQNRYIDKPISGYDDIEEGDYISLSVSDTGIGISPIDINRIFEPFYTKKVMGRSGTGLGMAVVWGTVKDHKGYIDVQSVEERGTTFTLYFPVTRQALARDDTPVLLEDYTGNGETILIVDDVEVQRDIALNILKKLGYSVTSVSSGEQAVDYLKENSVDLLVLDMIMDPGIDGLETYKKILEIHPFQKAIIASGFSETERVKEAQRLGAGVYLKKPYLIESVAVAVKTEIDKGI